MKYSKGRALGTRPCESGCGILGPVYVLFGGEDDDAVPVVDVVGLY